eukprot:TRINITY_DN7022_c0_g1_i1.p1 TRINITY_DN7022_c0_g1~~TRINITY_DN7022_c0_g1_i1.p1  ORF type:complete len:490 (-),score=174.57 TRINITY_DN7022_c0_g1_i1:327-1796(-)
MPERCNFLQLLLVLGAALSSADAAIIDADVTVFGTSSIWSIPDEYASVTLDWPRPGNDNATGWDGGTVLDIDFSVPILLALASQLTPAVLRIGGDRQDSMVYEIQHRAHANCTEGWTCLNMTVWADVQTFVAKTGFTLVFGLNELYNDHVPGNWSYFNTEGLLDYTLEEFPADAVYGWELGQAVSSVGNYSAASVAADFGMLQQLVDIMYPAGQKASLIGPDVANDVDWFAAFLKLFGANLAATTYHYYQVDGGAAHLASLLMNASVHDSIVPWAQAYLQAQQAYAPKAALWVGEMGPAYGGGQNGVTNRFVSSFWYLDMLGLLAQLKHSVFCRQTLMGGFYELIDHNTYEPNPDYWLLLLWKRLMGNKVLQTQVGSSTPNLRAYAHCREQGPGVVVAFVNLNSANVTYQVDISGIFDASNTTRVEYWLSAPSLDSNYVQLNGRVLQVGIFNHIPSLHGQPVDGSEPLQVAAQTIGFVEWPDASNLICA